MDKRLKNIERNISNILNDLDSGRFDGDVESMEQVHGILYDTFLLCVYAIHRTKHETLFDAYQQALGHCALIYTSLIEKETKRLISAETNNTHKKLI